MIHVRGSPATVTRSARSATTSQFASVNTASWSTSRASSLVQTDRWNVVAMMSVLPTKDARLVDVSTLVTEEEFVQLGRSVRCWTTRQSVSAQQDVIQVSPSVSRTRDVPETKHVSTSSARIPVMARYVPAIPPVLLRITNQSVNFVLLALWWTLIMDVFKVNRE